MANEVLSLREFPPFIRFELEEGFRRKIFSAFAKRVGEAEVEIPPETFWRSVEEEFERSRYELIFGSLSGKVLKTLESGPLEAKELLERNPELSPYSIYHALVTLQNRKFIKKKGTRWELKIGYFDQLRVSDLTKIIDLRQKGWRRKNALSITHLQMAVYLWPRYERACHRVGIAAQSTLYGKWYEDYFALARAVKGWASGDTNIPQWALIAIADLTGVDIEGHEVIVSYGLPPGAKITPYYKGRYKLPIEISADFDLIALQILMKSSECGLVHPVKCKKELFRRLYHTFGSFQSDRIPLSIREIIRQYYRVQCSEKSSLRIPERMKERWEKLSDHEQTITKILVLELLFNFDRGKRTYELISRSKGFLEDVSGLIRDLGAGEITIRKRKDRPHYRSYLPKDVVIKLRELKENVERFKIDKGIDFLDERERKELIREAKKYWGENGVNILSSLAMDKGVRDLDLARASGVTPHEVRRILYELEDQGIITYIRDETAELVEYYYYLNPEGIKRFLGEHRKWEPEESEKIKYPFPEEFTLYQRRRLYTGHLKIQ